MHRIIITSIVAAIIGKIFPPTVHIFWKFRYEKGVDEFYNTYTECGICKLGIRENCFEFVPCLCNMDERNYRNEGGQLHRTKTLAQGDDCCDFHVTKIKSES